MIIKLEFNLKLFVFLVDEEHHQDQKSGSEEFVRERKNEGFIDMQHFRPTNNCYLQSEFIP